ncbi:MAG: anti-sigma F factor [Ruminococcaceae bacterium]|nr:anti-sigma F factor [Oscillospiraceae bacterium]
MKQENIMTLSFMSKSSNEAFARAAVAAFIAQLDPTLEEINDIKTAVSEAVTNAIVHGYGCPDGTVTVSCRLLAERSVEIAISDTGRGIQDIEKARQPLYSDSEDLDRAGMGFTVMEAFMDDINIISSPGKGTTVQLYKKLQSHAV